MMKISPDFRSCLLSTHRLLANQIFETIAGAWKTDLKK